MQCVLQPMFGNKTQRQKQTNEKGTFCKEAYLPFKVEWDIVQSPLDLGNSLQVHTDTPGSLRFRIYLMGHLCFQRWPLLGWDWHLKGLYIPGIPPPHLSSCNNLARPFKNRQECFWCDNHAMLTGLSPLRALRLAAGLSSLNRAMVLDSLSVLYPFI